MKKMFQSAGVDISSSVVLFIVALPLCLGIAIGSNAPMFAGIIGGIVGAIVIGALSGSQLSVSGPAAGLTVIVASVIAKLPSFEAFLLAVVLAGLFQVIFGYLKGGIIGDYIPYSVIAGVLASIGLILILKQVPHFLGYHSSYEGDESFVQNNKENTFTSIIRSFKNSVPFAVIIGISALLIQLLWDKFLSRRWKFFRLIPAPLVVVVAAVLVNMLLKEAQHPWALSGNHLVAIPVAETIDGFVSFLKSPDFSYLNRRAVWIGAISIALIASLETLVNIEAADELDPCRSVTPTNRELKAQGIGNIISGLLGGLPLTSVIVRTSANINAGARSRLSVIVHGVWLLLSVMLIPRLLNLIPLCALAAVLIYIGFKLAKPSLFIEYYKKGLDQFVPFVITVIAILLTDMLTGVVIGITAGMFSVLRSNFKTAVFVVNDGNKYLVRLRKDVSFLNKPILKSKLEEVPRDSYVLIDATKANFIDRDVIEIINDFLKHAHLKNITVEIKRSLNKPMNQLTTPMNAKNESTVIPVLR